MKCIYNELNFFSFLFFFFFFFFFKISTVAFLFVLKFKVRLALRYMFFYGVKREMVVFSVTRACFLTKTNFHEYLPRPQATRIYSVLNQTGHSLAYALKSNLDKRREKYIHCALSRCKDAFY